MVVVGLSVVLIVLWIGGRVRASAQTALPSAQSSQSLDLRMAYARAIEKVEQLQQLKSSLDEQARATEAAGDERNRLKSAITAAAVQVKGTAADTVRTSTCRQGLKTGLGENLRTIGEFVNSARESLVRAADVGRASTPALATSAIALSDKVFATRFSRKRDLFERVAAAAGASESCADSLSSTSSSIRLVASAFVDVNRSAQALLSAVSRIQRNAMRSAEGAANARSRGWLTTDVGTVTFSSTPMLRVLAQRILVLDGTARLQLSDPHPFVAEQLLQYQDAALRLVVEQDAEQFVTMLAQNAALDCQAEECDRLLANVKDQRLRTVDALQDEESRLQQVEQALSADPGFGVFAAPTASWIGALRNVESAFASTDRELAAHINVSAGLLRALQRPVDAALDGAIAERKAVYMRLFGRDEPPEPPVPIIGGTASGAGSSAQPPPQAASIRRHAFEVLTLRATEAPGYGAYTYVILPVRESAAPEYQALLNAIVTLTPVALPTDSAAQKAATNLFEIPGKTADPVDSNDAPGYARDIRNYDWSRALSLVQIASSGVLSTSAVLKRFQQSPGPFLLTLPVPIEQAVSTTNLLLADLRGYPPEGFVDIVKSYQNGLVGAFPTTQTLWRPPWRQELALTLVRVGLLTGSQNFVVLAGQ